MEKNNKIISKITIIILYVVGLGVFIYASIRQISASSFLISPFGGTIMAVGLPAIMFKVTNGNKRKYMYVALGLSLVFINVVFSILNIKKYASSNVGNMDLINTQSYWYCSFNGLHRDVLIYTVLRNKTAVLSGNDVWHYKFVKAFSKNVEIDKTIDNKYVRERTAYYDAGVMRMRTMKDLLDEGTYTILDDGIKKREYQKLFIFLDGIEKSKKIAVFSDDDYNIYMRRYDE